MLDFFYFVELMHVQSATLEVCLHIHLLKVECFSVLIENQILKTGVYEHYFTSGPVFNSHNVQWKLQLSHEQTES